MTERHRTVIRGGLLLFIGAFLGNMAFLGHWPPARMLQMNDVVFILAGYHQTPHLLTDGLRWWHGPWIQVNAPALRPLAAYLYWIECWIGLHAGFVWNGVIGLLLFWANAVLSTMLAWRLTRSSFCTVFAGAMAVLARFYNAGQPDYWLVWFPVHQDLLMSGLLLGALLGFDLWNERADRRLLGLTWAVFVAACLVKEHAYIFPAFAAATAVLRRTRARVPRRDGLLQAGGMLAFVAVLSVYRAAVIPHPRNPFWHPVPLLKHLSLLQYNVLTRYLLTMGAWLPGLALLILVLALARRRLARTSFPPTARGTWAGRLYVWLPAVVLALGLYCTATVSLGVAFWYFVDIDGLDHLLDLGTAVAMLYSMFLLAKFRATEPSAAAWWWLLLSYVPVVNFLGWHYTLPACFLRAPYTALVLKLAWRDWTEGNDIVTVPPRVSALAALLAQMVAGLV